MTDNGTVIETNLTSAQQLGTWLKSSRELAERANCLDALEPVLKMLGKMGRESFNIVFVGSPNAGKSSSIDRLLDRQLLPVTSLASNTRFCIQGSADTEQEGFQLADNELPRPLEELHQKDLLSVSSESPISIQLSHPWLTDNNF